MVTPVSNAIIQRVIFIINIASVLLVGTWLHFAFRISWSEGIVIGIAIGIFVLALIIGYSFLFAWIATSPTPREYRIGVFGMLRCYVGELYASIRTFCWAQPWMANRPIAGESRTNSEKLPVLMLHGYFCNRAFWRPMSLKIDAAGHATTVVNLEPPFGSIEAYVPTIDTAVQALCKRTGARRVALLCHSMGGLAALAYLRTNGNAQVAKVITIGTPYRGTYHAQHGIGENAKQMRLKSPWRDALDMGDVKRFAHFTVILSHHDNIVVPRAIQVLEGAKVIEVAGIGHVAMVCDHGVQERVLEELCGPE